MMTPIKSFKVSVLAQTGTQQTALLTPATEEDMPTDWTFNWQLLWQATDFDCQNIVKLIYDKQLWGLVRYGVYPYSDSTSPEFLEIEHLETNPASRGQLSERLIIPIGKWLIWYAVQVGLQCCSGTDTLIVLVSLEDAINYYRDVIQMQCLGPTTIAPGEDGYAFKFSKKEAKAFCYRQENEWGVPTQLNL